MPVSDNPAVVRNRILNPLIHPIVSFITISCKTLLNRIKIKKHVHNIARKDLCIIGDEEGLNIVLKRRKSTG